MDAASTSAPRKRSRSDCAADRPAKHAKNRHEPCGPGAIVKQTLLAHYYTEVQTLRQYALSKLPTTSRIRRKKIATAGDGLGAFLDATLVALRQEGQDNKPDYRWEKWVNFSQKGDESYDITISAGLGASMYSQPEVSWRRRDGFEKLPESLTTLFI